MTAEFVSGLSLASLEVILYFTSLRAQRCLLHAISHPFPKPPNWSSSSPESHQNAPHHPATSSASCECSRAKQRWGIHDWWKRTRPCGTAFWNLWNPTQDANSDYYWWSTDYKEYPFFIPTWMAHMSSNDSMRDPCWEASFTNPLLRVKDPQNASCSERWLEMLLS